MQTDGTTNSEGSATITPIVKQTGSTVAESYLASLCDKSFLSMWSYPGIYRDQGKTEGGDGKEVCDLLVVFDNDIIIFSDKDCAFPDSGSLDRDWSRWFRRAVRNSAKQVWGAERWIREYPDRLFVDRSCKTRLPVSLPKEPRFHRVLVAHDAARRCKELLGGGSGSLILFTPLTGTAHESGPPPTEAGANSGYAQIWKKRGNYEGLVMPFTIGDIDPTKGFVHVFDDVALDVVLRTCDTAADFIQYLRSREDLIRGGKRILSPGEEDLLAYYLSTQDEDEHGFKIPDDPTASLIALAEGQWEALNRSDEWKARERLNSVSYFWDKLIETFNKYILDGTSPVFPEHDFAVQELAVRAMAREPRRYRRGLAIALTTLTQKRDNAFLNVRVVQPRTAERPYYVFLVIRRQQNESLDDYGKHRFGLMHAFAVTLKRQYPDAREVVVISTAPSDQPDCASFAVSCLDIANLTPEEEAMAKQFQDECGFLTKLNNPAYMALPEMPVKRPLRPPFQTVTNPIRRSSRNSPCPCGSGKKYKKCCMRNV